MVEKEMSLVFQSAAATFILCRASSANSLNIWERWQVSTAPIPTQPLLILPFFPLRPLTPSMS